ncbi:MAG: type IX secretion system membrane protein PorP/SprF [Bacteroidota bacterium]
MKKIFTLILVLTIAAASYAQQNSPFSQYIFNQMIINPAYVGTKQLISINGTYSTQWTGFKGAPSTQTISAEGGLNKNMGLGIHFLNDRIGAQYQQGLFASYSYIIKFNEKWRMSLGIAAGISNFTLDGTKLIIDNPDDPAIPKTKVSSVRFDSKAGLFLYSRRFYFGFSATDLFADVMQSKDLLVAKQSRHYYVTAGYVFDAGKNLKIKPSFLYREDFKAPTNIDINCFFLIKERFWIGASVRFGANIFKNASLDNTLKHRDAMVFMTDWNITRNLRIGYAYTWSLTALKGYSGHEVVVGYTFPKKADTKMRTPRYF